MESESEMIEEILPTSNKRKRQQAKFQFKKREKLEKREMEELRKTNTSVLSGLVNKENKTVPQVELENMDWEDRDRQENAQKANRICFITKTKQIRFSISSSKLKQIKSI